MTYNEFVLAQKYINNYSRLSKYDCIALSIAKERNIILLTGDKALRKAAIKENVVIMGIIGISDQLNLHQLISKDEYLYCLKELLKNNGIKIRLPENELKSRIKKTERLIVNH